MAGSDERDWRELIASSDRHAAHAQRYIERVTPHLDPVFDLPWAVRLRVATEPVVELTSRHRC